MDDLIYLPVPDIRFKDLYDWCVEAEVRKVTLVSSPRKNGLTEPKPRDKGCGSLVNSNKRDIALFRYKEKVFAVKESCPHADGPLHLGDIEDLGDNILCVKCPWHGYKIDLHTGKVMHPKGHDLYTTVYPVKVKEDGVIFIGFSGFDASYFDITAEENTF